MSEEIDGVIGTHDSKGQTVVIVISGELKKAEAEKLKAELNKVVKGYGLTVKVKKSK